ncbi:sensor histidine kinase [Streptomyces sp. NBC_01724]|uniref:sensor histidine kinase n=1 Tax=unclassified Streptomyces TaxID=2593676 RepID=UPI0028C448F6|nr:MULTISPECIES: sensor histidine kinase [unclassified Streptomyces]WNO66277.1 sensor histidine kinase [Streptomyces sp. AM2-3-1]WSC70812.1 sensor histidine kinase [Streptomyces sp. NBC_01760]WTE61290.1 sensor histidine kinase [Streptomyces sp. NBC_01617]WTI88704.1 sensor histidine kinase [Streptomyces sp. NBC_00724]
MDVSAQVKQQLIRQSAGSKRYEVEHRTEATDPDDRRLALLMHAAFFLLLGASLTRFLLRHPGEDRTPWIIALSVALAALYLLGPALGSRPTPRRLARLGVLVAVWMVLVVLAPSFAWCAVPLFYTGLRLLPPRAAFALVALLTVFVVAAQLRLAHGFDPNLVLAPPAVAATATAVFVHMQRQGVRQRELIDDLLRTRRELAATERREGTLAERQRLSMEIHDTLAQGLSSQQMLLQAADRTWEADPATARRHVRTATGIAERNLAEARRFVHDLAPADLAEGGGLEAALRALATRETAQAQGLLTVRCHVEGTPHAALPERVQSALLRIAQGALANVKEHADATEAALTLTHLDDRTVLDIADNGRGFTPPAPTALRPAAGVRGHGVPAMRARLHQLGGTLTIESAPGDGTVVSAEVPLPAPSSSPAPSPSPEEPS